ncbi:MAG: glycoside hydrolase family 5 protein [Spirochaetes bacterium]|nr:glycoside hydrolase family 5 protein [Spirochaetota bacterium]
MAFTVKFSRGVNFSKWFEFKSVRDIQFERFVEQDFANVKSIGSDVVRLPIAMHNFTSGAPGYTIDPVFIKYLDSAVDWAEKHKLHIILDNHSFHPVNPTDVNIDRVLIPVWEQIAGHYRDRSNYVLYEILNEPHHIADERWGEIQGMTIEAIRKIDKKHTIIAGGTGYNSIEKLTALPAYKDNNLIYTFHFYDPHLFTHQGATWENPSLSSLKGLPFPAEKNRIPETPTDLKGTWVEKALESYEKDAAPETLFAALDKAAAFSKERDVQVFCGEFGVFMIQSPEADRVNWYKLICDALNKRSIPWTSWDYFGGFGIFKTGKKGDFKSDVNVDVIKAMGFNI